MASNGFTQQTLNNESPSKPSSQRGLRGSPSKPSRRGLRGSPPSPTSLHKRRTRIEFGSPDEASPVGELKFGSPVRSPATQLHFGSPAISPAAQLNFGSPAVSPDESSSREESAIFIVNSQTPPPPVPETKKKEDDIELAVPVSEFLRSLTAYGVLSPLPSETPTFSSPSTPQVGLGSFTTAFLSPDDPDYVIKISELGTNGKSKNGDAPKVDNKELLSFLIASNKCLGDPNCAKVSKTRISQNPNGTWMMCVEQERCSPLTSKDAKRFLECFIALFRKFLPSGVYPKDFKMSNFGKNASGQVVWFDFDFGNVKKKMQVPNMVSSGDFQFDGNEQFQRLLLALIELFCHPITSFFHPPLIKDRKDVFRVLNKEKGLLQKYGLLSSDKSVSETTIEDFAKVLRNIGLSEEDITYLVGLITLPASSQ